MYKAKYLGGYSAFPGPIDVTLDLERDCLVVPELNLQIPYKELTAVRNVSVTEAARLFFVGGYGMAWRKEKPLLLLSFKDDAGMEQNPAFDVENLLEVQPIIYQKMLEAKGVKIKGKVKNAKTKSKARTCGTCMLFRRPALCPLREVNPHATACAWYRKPKARAPRRVI